MKYHYYIVDVFSPESFGGNQLAVLPNAQGLTPEGMQKIAREFNFAESTFVFPPRDGESTARVRIFTPKSEVDFAGHPTVGTACALVYGNHIDADEIILDENIGHVVVQIEKKGTVLSGTLINTSKLDHPVERPDPISLATVLSLHEEEVVDSFFAGVGLNFCFAHLATQEAVDRAAIDKTVWKELLSDALSSNIFLYSGDLIQGGTIYARMFAPAFGIEEDPATGSAVAALVGVAGMRSGIKNGKFVLSVVQGVSMGRTSKMAAAAVLKEGSIDSVSVGGPTSFTARGEIEIDDHWLESGSIS